MPNRQVRATVPLAVARPLLSPCREAAEARLWSAAFGTRFEPGIVLWGRARSVWEALPADLSRTGWQSAPGCVSTEATTTSRPSVLACSLTRDSPSRHTREPSRRLLENFAPRPIGFVTGDLTRPCFCRTLHF